MTRKLVGIVGLGVMFHLDTVRRIEALRGDGVHHVGVGMSAGEEGALRAASIMPGGDSAAWPTIRPLLEAIAARPEDGAPCCARLGSGDGGHLVKMVHNGIEYADRKTVCKSYRASQKSLDLGVPAPTFAAAVFTRTLSAMKRERVAGSALLAGPAPRVRDDRGAFVEDTRRALFAAKTCSYAQGSQLLRSADLAYGWNQNLGTVASLWRAGCIIRAQFLGKIRAANEEEPTLAHVLPYPHFAAVLRAYHPALRAVVAAAAENGVAVPAFMSAPKYYDGYRSERLPSNLLQAHRDYLVARGYERANRAGRSHTDLGAVSGAPHGAPS